LLTLYYNSTPNPVKIALLLEELEVPYTVVPIDLCKGDQHQAEFRALNPNGKVPVVIDNDGTRIFDSSAILLYFAEKARRFLGKPDERAELLSWLFFVATGVGPFSGQAIHFQHAVQEPVPYAVNRFRREIERHYRVLDQHLQNREYILGAEYSIVDMSAWGWIDRAPRILPGEDDPLQRFTNLKRLFDVINKRPAANRARQLAKKYTFDLTLTEETRRIIFPSAYPLAEA
jgi:GSH-dependent disulfide-bond oxidoreductase